MDKILELISSDKEISAVIEKFSRQDDFSILGLSSTAKVAVIAAALKKNPRPTIIIADKEKIPAWQSDLQEFLPNVEVVEFPEADLFGVRAGIVGLERKARRLEILTRLLNGESIIVLASPVAVVKKDFSREIFSHSQIKISRGQNLSREKFLNELVNFGYERADEIDAIGKFSVRGGIVDVFPLNLQAPFRIEFYDEVVDSIRELSTETLRSVKSLNAVTILPVTEIEVNAVEGANFEPVTTCAEKVIFDEPARLKEKIDALTREDPELRQKIFSFDEILVKSEELGVKSKLPATRYKLQAIFIETLGTNEFIQPDAVRVTHSPVPSFNAQLDFLMTEVKAQLKLERKIFILFTIQKKLERIKNFFAAHNVDVVRSEELGVKSSLPTTGYRLPAIFLQLGTLGEGFSFPGANVTVITEKDIFGSQREKRRNKPTYAGDTIKHFSEIRVGDYVVHPTNGIGKYLGIETLELDGVRRDYLHLQYGGGDKIYLPTESVNRLQKYIAGENAVPVLSKLNTGDWARAKSRAAAAVEDIAEKLIEIYAKRLAAEGFAFAPDDVTQIDFEDNFPYEETLEQIKAVNEVKADMESARPMDRLICGDVGFGKTEVAIRAAYKAAINGKQVAMLVPTTVLAQQHYQTFSERFKNFEPTVDVICRFRTPKEQRVTLQKVRAGLVDILIGTHSLLNSKVEFKNLGLLIIDEEQRFGVKQKEKIRSLTAGVDVLALSATPIPRTLHMSLVSARDMSLITTPPENRFPVQTYVIEDDDAIIADAIRREIRRGGQVYFVYNKIETIDLMHAHLSKLVPEAKIQTAHGQQSDIFLENVMMDFYEGAFDVLLSTTIIENGLDVPNANTIIVYNADHFGLAQLYQMRGRVGRSNQMAFAYFVYKRDKVLTEKAVKRLQAMKEFAQLGAGFKIAMRDLEIRGAGNLLGAQQHGHIASVGFEMYCQLLEEAVSRLQKSPAAKAEVEPAVTLPVEAYIDKDFIPDSMHKIEIYQRLAVVKEEKEIDDLLDEIIDRFGEPTEPVVNLLNVARVKTLAKKIGVKTITLNGRRLEIAFTDSPKISPAGYVALQNKYQSRFRDSQKTKEIFIDLVWKKDFFREVLLILRKLNS
ncbi:MAG: transcription-repair coupling factor [Selenomonadaceae bacterium]|nr:transcription-repair coupling factor [Selenomonadaceae bacterium]